MCARSTTQWAVVRERVNCSKRLRSPGRKATIRMGSGMAHNIPLIAVSCHSSPYHDYFCDTTLLCGVTCQVLSFRVIGAHTQ